MATAAEQVGGGAAVPDFPRHDGLGGGERLGRILARTFVEHRRRGPKPHLSAHLTQARMADPQPWFQAEAK